MVFFERKRQFHFTLYFSVINQMREKQNKRKFTFLIGIRHLSTKHFSHKALAMIFNGYRLTLYFAMS